jgi:transcriptional regulator with XRE-family HTH domain
VAARAGVSVTWYTWLEQGRGGPPSDEVLARLSKALELDAPARELLYLLAQQRPPPLTAPIAPASVAPALQRVIDAMPASPAIIKTVTWDILAWNLAAEAVLGGGRPLVERNMLRRMFGDPALREALPDWEENARLALAVFRVDVARSGGSAEALALVEELQAVNPDFRRLWAENDVRTHGFGQKRIDHPQVGVITLEFSTFVVDGAEGLTMIVFAPATAADARAVEAAIARQGAAA